MLINGEWCDGKAREYMESINPATGEINAVFCRGDKHDVNRAVEAARTAFETGEWPAMGYKDRAEILRQIAEVINDHSIELARMETLDNGKPIKESTLIDIPTTADTFKAFAAMGEALKGETIKSDPALFSYTMYEPLGVCAQIIPWNYPLIMAAWKLAPALMAGNTVVIKPSELTSLSLLALAALFDETDLPPGVVNIVTGTGDEVGRPLAAHPGIDKIAFTGSTATGGDIMHQAASTITRHTLELGGKSPVIVTNHAHIEAAVDGVMAGIFLNQGQMCTAGSRLLLQADIYDDFIRQLRAKTEKIKAGNGMNPETSMGPLISAAHRDKVLDYITIGLEEGATLTSGGDVPEDEACKDGFFITPTIFTNVTPEMRIAREEIFGPVLTVFSFDTLDDAVALANDTDYGLACSIWSTDIYEVNHLSSKVKAGTIWVNTYGSFLNEVPFGGYKKSGIGRELGKAGLLEYTQLKSVTIDASKDRIPLISKWYGF